MSKSGRLDACLAALDFEMHEIQIRETIFFLKKKLIYVPTCQCLEEGVRQLLGQPWHLARRPRRCYVFRIVPASVGTLAVEGVQLRGLAEISPVLLQALGKLGC